MCTFHGADHWLFEVTQLVLLTADAGGACPDDDGHRKQGTIIKTKPPTPSARIDIGFARFERLVMANADAAGNLSGRNAGIADLSLFVAHTVPNGLHGFQQVFQTRSQSTTTSLG